MDVISVSNSKVANRILIGCRFRVTLKTNKWHSDDTVQFFINSDGRVVRASASGAVNSSLIPSRVKPMTLMKLLVFTASMLDAQYQKDSVTVENKPASLLVVLLVGT